MKDLRTLNSYRLSVLLFFLGFLVLAIFFSIRFGSTQYSWKEIFHFLFVDTAATKHRILVKLRVPRALTAGLVGFCLSLAGCLLQGITRNPLASPNIIGVSAGAGLVAVFIFILFPNNYYLVTPFAFMGAFLTTIMVYILAWKGGASPLRLVLSGIAVASFLSAISNALMIFFPDRVHNVIGFMVGSLSTITWKQVYGLWPYAGGGFLVSYFLADQLNILLLGDETATSLGVKVEKIRLVFIILASLLAAAAVSVVGLLGFVGLIVPHLARLVIGNNARFLIPGSALLGAIVVILCDLIGRVIMRPLELPVGIIMAILGAPFFLFLLRRGGVKINQGSKKSGH
ncbi:MAG: iron ABC transporter permease [Spirochaetes bacterium]|nr:iron ABC transporter permease [Spirochaetota bacterium]